MLVRKAPDNPQTHGRDTSKQASSRWMDGQIRYHLQVTGTKEEGRPSPVQGQLSPVEAKRDDSFAAAATQVIPYQVGGIAAKRETHQCFAASKPLMQTASFHVTLFHNRDSQDTHIWATAASVSLAALKPIARLIPAWLVQLPQSSGWF